MANLVIGNQQDLIQKAKESFPIFIQFVFPCSFKPDLPKATHTYIWADRMQKNRLTVTMSARKHLKSTTLYAFVMWLIFKLDNEANERYLYMSFNQKMSSYHTENIKQLIRANDYFSDVKDLTDSEGTLKYSTNGKNRFVCEPSGILTFNRGWHGDGIICDDILQDPTNQLNYGIIDKINRLFMEVLMSLPKEGGFVHLAGTPQHQEDLFFKLRDNPKWNWGEYKAIINEKDEIVLWKDVFPYERLIEIRNHELGEKVFSKEYMCLPVWSAEAYFTRDQIMKTIEGETIMRHASEWKQGSIIAGVDIGKKAHPTHIALFQYDKGIYRMIYSRFLDGWDYTKQIEVIKAMQEYYLVDEIRYDNTRSEFESFKEQNEIDKLWVPVVFTQQSKWKMASNFSKLVEQGRVKLLNDQRMINSILSVNNKLEAVESSIGHGDAFWSICLALSEKPIGGGYFAL